MNNKPVAWIDEETGCFVYSQYDYEDLDEHGKDGLIPLYTHPVKEDEGKVCARCGAIAYDPVITQTVKELTDEEIKQIFVEQTGFYFDDNPADDLALMDFARAILRKAQEK